jgi:hypothetical protein
VPKRSDNGCENRFEVHSCLINTRIGEQPPVSTDGSAKGCSEIEKPGTTEKDTT